MRQWSAPDPHTLEVSEVLRVLEVDEEVGLDPAEVVRRRRVVGRNALEQRRALSGWSILWDQVRSAVVLLLLVAVVAGLAIGEVVEALAVAVVVAVNTVVGFVTELRAVRSMEALQRLAGSVADVERQDRRDEIDAVDLVPGDIVAVEAGDRVPADIRLLEASDLQVEESALTGESETVHKSTDAVPAHAPLAERSGMLYTGTTVRAGRGRGVVVATGTATEVGRIADLAAATDTMQAPLQAGLERLGRTLSLVVVALATALAGLGAVRGLEINEVLEVSIALAVAIVPEGLPAVATLTLTVGMRRMARQNALVRRLPTVETLGSTSVIASDKTGTLTANEMQGRVDFHDPRGSTKPRSGGLRCCATTPTSHPTATPSATRPKSPSFKVPPQRGSTGEPNATPMTATTRSPSTRPPNAWPWSSTAASMPRARPRCCSIPTPTPTWRPGSTR